MSWLKYLNLGDFNSIVPHWIGSLETSVHLDLSDCRLYNQLPLDWQIVTGLKFLNLLSNNLNFNFFLTGLVALVIFGYIQGEVYYNRQFNVFGPIFQKEVDPLQKEAYAACSVESIRIDSPSPWCGGRNAVRFRIPNVLPSYLRSKVITYALSCQVQTKRSEVKKKLIKRRLQATDILMKEFIKYRVMNTDILMHQRAGNWAGAARTQAPTTTNYDVGSTTWADLRRAPLPSAMEVANLGHGPS
ncbi:leucine-rich receptor-like protein kinase family protein [Striga asiatica]|uniref:Leucine-rich receptor-like protein kinase family protein n=1 Tax=Striga asiatica TaxID=4170 RepID=A0A5A7QMK7_STRAF|nr:leucine-rich receptor-like protein kinase family protein [Striga asiatica]